jgi:hypothetical protein
MSGWHWRIVQVQTAQDCKGGLFPGEWPPRKGHLIHLASWCRQGRVGPALTDSARRTFPRPPRPLFEVPLPYLVNHQASAIHNGVTVSSALQIPRANALASEQDISRSRSSQAFLCARNSKSSTSPLRILYSRDVLSIFTLINLPFMYS